MADQMVPRFTADAMPKPAPEPLPGSQAKPPYHVPPAAAANK